MLYNALRPILFSMDPERSHETALAVIGTLGRRPATRWLLSKLTGAKSGSMPIRLAGLKLQNPVGLAAGLDKHASATAGLLALGFGFVELGTVTPRPQDGNPRPRLFRLRSERAIINRMGFNSAGFDAFRRSLIREPLAARRGAVGINIGKNAATPLDQAVNDYVLGLEFAHGLGDYITMNVSSPNTRDLRALQSGDELGRLLETTAETREQLAARDGMRQPVLIKIAPDAMTDEALGFIVDGALSTGIDGIINTNTTVGRTGIESSPYASEAGGLSGRPLTELSRDVNRRLCQAAAGRLDIVSCGGIDNAEEAWTRLTDGATALQVYTGFVYRGPALPGEILSGLERKIATLHSNSLPEALDRAHSSHDRPAERHNS